MVTVMKRRRIPRKGREDNGWCPRISIANTDVNIINEAIDILSAVKIPHYVQTKKNGKHPEWKLKYEIIIQGIKRCENALSKLNQFLVGKKRKADALLAFCKYRLSVPSSQLTSQDFILINLVRENSIPPRDYTPDAFGEDIVRSA